MDATRLPPPAEAAAAPSVTVPDQPTPIGGRFIPLGMGVPTPTGSVSDATDTQGGSAVALKLVPPAVLPTPTMADRALRELKQLAKVTSERIVRVIDQGKLPDGRIYVATEKTEGAVSLEEIVGREGPMAIERARAIVLSVGEALTEAQKVGVIHRDVAPRNVLVGPGDRVKVADFGLAEPVPGSELGPSGAGGGAERSGTRVFGAPAFLSPEQAEGKPVDQRSNIYSLGAMYYFALTGAPPFAGDSASLLQQQLSAAPVPPSHKRPELGADIDRVILKALEKNGGRRHLTLRQLLTEIGAAAAGVVRVSDQSGPVPLVPASVVAQPQPRSGAGAQTVMGMASPVASMGPSPSKPVANVPAPVGNVGSPAGNVPSAAPSGPAPAPQRAVPQAATMVMGAVAPPGAAAPPPSAAAPPPSTTPAAPQATPQKAPPQAATMMAEAPVLPSPPQPQPQPQKAPPQAATMMAEAPPRAAVAAPAAAARVGNDTGKKKGFRETAWFKRGELEEELARAQASAGDNPLKSGVTGKLQPLDDAQIDLSQQDAQRLSLKTGATQAMPILKGPQAGALPGERMNEAEMLAEISGSRRTIFIIGAVVLAILLALIVYFVTHGGGTPAAEAPPAAKPAPVAASPPAATPAPAAPAASASLAKSPASPLPTPSPPTKTPPPPGHVSGNAAPGAELAAAVEKVESTGDKREAKRLERAVLLDQKRARLRKDRATEAADGQLLVRLKRVGAKKKR